MKTKARQEDLPMNDDAFRLVTETAEDGDRIAAERERREREKREAAKRQLPLF